MKLDSTTPEQEAGFRPDVPAATFVPEPDLIVENLVHEPPKPKVKEKKRKRPRRSLWSHLGRLVVVLSILFGLYLTAVFSEIPFIAKWRTIYIQTAMATMRHQWLATYFIPGFVIDDALSELEQSRQLQIGINSTWNKVTDVDLPEDEDDIIIRNPTLTDTRGMKKEQIAFYNDFWEIDVDTMEDYVREHPDVLKNGWANININKSGLSEDGTSIRTHMGEKVLAINAPERILIVREQGTNYRGLMAVRSPPRTTASSASRRPASWTTAASAAAQSRSATACATACPTAGICRQAISGSSCMRTTACTSVTPRRSWIPPRRTVWSSLRQ